MTLLYVTVRTAVCSFSFQMSLTYLTILPLTILPVTLCCDHCLHAKMSYTCWSTYKLLRGLSEIDELAILFCLLLTLCETNMIHWVYKPVLKLQDL